jgi:protein-glutamine gamma-glutamyltransferase
MILIANNPIDTQELNSSYPQNSIQRDIINILSESESKYRYDSIDELKFELDLRSEIVDSAKALYKSGINFAVFRRSECNEKYWNRTEEGGFILKEDASPSDAISDIYINGSLYATECATAMVIVYYKAILNIYKKELFDSTFKKIHLMNWHYIDRNLKEIGYMEKANDYLPGDRRYFANPDVDPITPEWQGENVIDLGNGRYYGHGIGITTAETIINELNKNRVDDAEKSAYLMDSAGRPDFKRLFKLYKN